MYCGSSPNIYGIMLYEMLSNLRYLFINFPPQVISMYQAKFTYPKLIEEYGFEDWFFNHLILPATYRFYGFSIYYLNNVQETLFYSLILFLAGIFVLMTFTLIHRFAKKIKRPKLDKVKEFLMLIFVWDMLLFYVFANHQTIWIAIASSFTFRDSQTNDGIINITLACITFLVLFLGFLRFIPIIKGCTSTMLEKMNTLNKYRLRQIHLFGDSRIKKWKQFWDWVKTPLFNFYEGEKPLKQTQDPTSPVLANNNEISQERTQVEYLSPEGEKVSLIKKCFPIKRPDDVVADQEEAFLRFQMIHVNLNYFTKSQKYFFLLFVVRIFVVSMVTILLYPHAMGQISIIFVVNFIFLIYAIKTKPFNNFYDSLVYFGDEILAFITVSYVLVLAAMDFQDNFDWKVRSHYGWLTVSFYLLLIGWTVITSFVKIVVKLIIMITKLKMYKRTVPEKLSAEKL